MRLCRQFILRVKDQRGVSAIIVGLVMVMLFGFASLVVDLGYVMVTRNELQNIADASALAAMRQLGVIYDQMSIENQQTYVCDPATILPAVQDVAGRNQAGGESIVIRSDDVIIGTWNSQTKILTPTLTRPDAVRVIARRDLNANGPLPTFFARVLGRNTVEVSATGTAALSSPSKIPEGGLPSPGAISEQWFANNGEFCDQPIRFYPTGDIAGCAGWTTFEEGPSSAAALKKILEGLMPISAGDGTYTQSYQSPEAVAGVTDFWFTGGNDSKAFSYMKDLFDAMKGLNDGKLDGDNDSTTWTVTVPVYHATDCKNPHSEITIIGFASVTITEILTAPDKTIEAKVRCQNVTTGRGGGRNFGTLGSIPGLVQ